MAPYYIGGHKNRYNSEETVRVNNPCS